MKRENPTRPEEITSAWLTQSLRDAGVIDRAVVRSFRAQQIGMEAGYCGRLVRLEPDYVRPEPGAPASLVGKLTSADPAKAAFSGPLAGREVRFYDELSSRIALPIPRCYYSAFDRGTATEILLLEDLSHLRQVDILAGCREEEAERVIRHLARMHARWWESPELHSRSWLPSLSSYADYPVRDWWELYPRRILELLPDEEPPEVFFEIGRRFSADANGVFDRLAAPPTTCVHRDVQAENFFLGSSEETPSFVLFDWAFVARGRGVSDVTYFMLSSLSPAQRRSSEKRLLELYHELLVQGGVREYGLDDCRLDYRRSFFGKLLITVVGTVLFDNTSAARKAWRRADLERLVAFAEDHAVEELV